MYHPTFEQQQRMDELNRRADAARRREREEAQAIDAEWERVTRMHTPETAEAELAALTARRDVGELTTEQFTAEAASVKFRTVVPVSPADRVAQTLAAIANPNAIDKLSDEQIDTLWKAL